MTAQEQLKTLLQQWIASTKTGKAIPLAELCKDCPELLPEVEKRVKQMIADAKAKKVAQAKISTGSAMAVGEATSVQQHAPGSQPTLSDGYPSELGGYKLTKVLGEGGMGRVYLAEDPQFGREVAIKVMKPEVATNPELRQRFLHEARSTARLEHDHVIAIFQVGEEKQIPFLVMPFLKGEPLDAKLKREGKLSIKESIRIAREMAEGLASAHQKGLIHRDIKPANVWLEGERRRVKILDFGLAKATQAGAEGLTQTGAIMGTPAYMAPEQARGKEVDFRCDLFSLGCVLYQMITGQRPFTGSDTMAILTSLAVDTPDSAIKLNRLCPQRLSRLTEQLLAKKPDDRPASAQILADALTLLLQEQDAPTQIVVPVLNEPIAVPAADPWANLDDQTDLVSAAPKARRADPVRGRVSDSSKNAAPDSAGSPGKPGSNRKLLMGGLGGFVLLLIGFIIIKITNKDGTVTEIKVPEGATIEIGFDRKETEEQKKGKLPPSPRKELPKEAPSLAKAPFDGQRARAHQEAWAKYLGTEVETKNTIDMKFVLIPPSGDALPKPYWLGKYEVTQGEFEAVMGFNISRWHKGNKETEGRYTNRLPVEFVSWYDAVEFCNKLSELEKLPPYYQLTVKNRRNDGKRIDLAEVKILGGNSYHIPTDAEWEYACRAGTTTKYHSGDKDEDLLEYAWIKPNSNDHTHPVGEKKPNAFGLHDIHGNVREWLEDEYEMGKSGVPHRATRGGNFVFIADFSGMQIRNTYEPNYCYFDFGFRVARGFGEEQKKGK